MERRVSLRRILRYVATALLAIAPIWALAGGYLAGAPTRYATEVIMILPGEGSSASVNLDRVGQASSAAASPWASNRLSPVEAYRTLIATERVHREAAALRGLSPDAFPRPKIKLTDQTSFITVGIRGNSPDGARANGQALIDAFRTELDRLRNGYASERDAPGRAAIRMHQEKVDATRQAVVDFQVRTGLVSEDQFNERILTIERTTRRIRDVETELKGSEREVASLMAALGTDAADAAQALKLRADPIFQGLLSEMTETKIAFERARMTYGDQHPDYLDARRAYASITDAMVDRGRVITKNDEAGFRAIADLATHGEREEMLGELVRRTAQRDGLLATHAGLYDRLVRVREDVGRLAGPAAELDHLVREHQVALAVFTSALAKADTTKADKFAAYPLVQVIQPPLANPVPVSPNRRIALVGAVAGTLFMLFGLTMTWARGSILGLLGRAFAHPATEAAAAPPAPPERRREPPMPDNRALDDEPLIEIPRQTEYSISYSYDAGLRRNRKGGRG